VIYKSYSECICCIPADNILTPVISVVVSISSSLILCSLLHLHTRRHNPRLLIILHNGFKLDHRYLTYQHQLECEYHALNIFGGTYSRQTTKTNAKRQRYTGYKLWISRRQYIRMGSNADDTRRL